MVNWRNIKELGLPNDPELTYLVTDGRFIATTDIVTSIDSNGGGHKFKEWTGDGFTYEDNQCCSGPRCFELEPTHWCPTNEINLPNS